MTSPGPAGDASSQNSQRGAATSRTRRFSPVMTKGADGGPVRDLASAQSFLERKGYVASGETNTTAGLSIILSQIASLSTQATIRDLIRAVALILEAINDDATAERVSEAVKSSIGVTLGSQLETLATLSARMTEYTDRIGDLAENLEGCVNGFNNVGEYIGEQSKDAAERMHETIDALQGDIDQIGKFAAETPAKTSLQQPTSTTTRIDPFSYAQITQRHLPATHASTLARSNERQRQILIESAPGMPEEQGLTSLTEAELVVKANTAFDLMDIEKEQAPAVFRFVAAKKLTRGGVLLNLNSVEAASWIRRPDVREAFMGKFGGMSRMRDIECRVLGEFIPVGFDPDAAGVTSRIEEDSGLEANSISRMLWAKALARRKPGQLVAHLIIVFNSPENANHAIRNSLYIAGRKTNTRMMVREPQRCAKCQRYGHGNNEGAPHFAKDCKWVHDTCGGCGHNHRRDDCAANLAIDSFCVNCNTKGHPAWDRNCPTFLERREKLNRVRHKQNYRFFVTEDVNTWETLTDIPATAVPTTEADTLGEDWRHTRSRGTSGRGGRGGYTGAQRGTSNRGRPASRGTASGERTATQANATALGPRNRGGGGLTQLTLDDVNIRVCSQTQGSVPNAPIPFPPATQPQPADPSPPMTPIPTPPQNQRRHSWGSLADGLPTLGPGAPPQ
jgi:hypothetical protein